MKKWEPYAEFANFILRFGDSLKLLDLAEEVVIPAFLNPGVVRTYGSTTYFLYQTQLTEIPFEGKSKLCLVGRFVKNTTLQRNQIFDEEQGLIQDTQAMESAPSSIFVLVLSNHKLLYFHETPNAPDLSSFRATVELNISAVYEGYIRNTVAQRQEKALAEARPGSRPPRVTLKSVRQELPRLSLEIIPLTNEDDFAAFLERLSVLTNVRIELVDPNDDTDNNSFFEQWRENKDLLAAAKTALNFHNQEGLNKEAAVVQLSAATEQGNSRITLSGKDTGGNDVLVDNNKFRTRVSIPVIDDFVGTISRMYEAYQNFRQRGMNVDEDETTDADAKVAAIQDRANIGNG